MNCSVLSYVCTGVYHHCYVQEAYDNSGAGTCEFEVKNL